MAPLTTIESLKLPSGYDTYSVNVWVRNRYDMYVRMYDNKYTSRATHFRGERGRREEEERRERGGREEGEEGGEEREREGEEQIAT